MLTPDQTRVLTRTRRPALLLLALTLSGCAAAPSTQRPLDSVVTEVPLRADSVLVIPPAEHCRYAIGWGPLTVGHMEYTTGLIQTSSGPLLTLTQRTQATGLARMFLSFSGTMRSLVERSTMLPQTSLWTTGERNDPQVRSVDFRQDQHLARSVKYTSKWMVWRTVLGPRIHDSLSSIYLLRIIQEPPAEGLRLLVVEGENVHLMTIRPSGKEVLKWKGQDILCSKLALRTDRIDDQGRFLDAKPWNNLFVWVAEKPQRPILKMSGLSSLGGIVLTLEERILAGSVWP